MKHVHRCFVLSTHTQRNTHTHTHKYLLSDRDREKAMLEREGSDATRQ